MSSRRGNHTSVADNARREAKLLAKPTKLTLDPFGKTDVELKQPYPKELGEYAVIVIVTPMTSIQFTIAHPIGITDLEGASWVAHRSDQIQGMLARAKDPNQASVDQSRAAYRNALAVANLLLKEVELDGKKKFFYPHRNDADRNKLLEDARAKSKEAASKVKLQIANLPEDQKHDKQKLMTQLAHAEETLNFLDETTSKAEVALRKFYQSTWVTDEVTKKYPQSYRTLSGPYFTIPQVKIPGSENLRLEDVAIRFAREFAKGTAVSAPPETKAAPPPKAVETVFAAKSPVKATLDSSPPKPSEAESPWEDEFPPDSGKKGVLSRLTGRTSKNRDQGI